jgi:spore coat polysaccharide biosynthesis protein SpsF (cytidylyltransferase family)
MFDGQLVRKIIKAWSNQLDILTNKSPRTFPKGQTIEIVNRETFIQSYQHFKSNDDFEHVTHYFHRNLEYFTFRNIFNSVDHSKFSLAIDEPVDLLKFETFVTQNGVSWVELSYNDILAIYPNGHND